MDGKRMYKNALDCFIKTVQSEGVRGLYKGLPPQLVGVAPEKAIKLTINDMLREAFTKIDHGSGERTIHFGLEVLSGACAGACQVLVTNPLEITKIRLQIQGETARLLREAGKPIPPPLSTIAIAKELGLAGLYKGASACLLRDIPFSAIYFPAYAATRKWLTTREGSSGVSAANLLLAGALAGIPAAFLCTMPDVIKTRLQVARREGDMVYTGIRDCAIKIYRHEGFTAFFKGSAMRVFRSSPQFGITLLAYEKLGNLFGLTHENPPTNAPIDPIDYRSAFPTHPLRKLDAKAHDIHGFLHHFGFSFGGTK